MSDTKILYASRRFEDLHPEVAKLARAFVIECEAQSIPVLITSTFRSADSIAAHDAFVIHRTGKNHHVPDYEYLHAYRVAFDFVPILHGKCQWNDMPAFYACGKIAEEMGLDWGGRFNEPDPEHCQFTNGLSVSDFKKATLLIN